MIQALPAVQRERMEERSVQDATILLHRFPSWQGYTPREQGRQEEKLRMKPRPIAQDLEPRFPTGTNRARHELHLRARKQPRLSAPTSRDW
ncbi:hypothetical protein ASZ90_015218 [hydrocarbon metagenome]|uniref:Uncharacterized protein n=1 Tax=hydrocarbon metagenome TaxID=938273 RepID=A0A0W8F402_9ZZZZ